MSIKKVSIIGMGSLGLLFGSFLVDKIGNENVEFVVNEDRFSNYSKKIRLINGKRYDFKVVSENEEDNPSDLVIFAVKSTNLEDAIKVVRNKVSDKTSIISLLNGISSEEIIGKSFGMDKVLYSIAEGMDPVREGDSLNYTNMGYLRIGIDAQNHGNEERLNNLINFFDKISFPYKYEKDVIHRLWSKFMLNVGVNQVVMLEEGTFSTIQKPGPERELMILAMKEVISLAKKENVHVTEDDLNFYVQLVDTLNPNGIPSMRHDGIQKVKSEVEIFSGMVLLLSKKHNLSVPINEEIYMKIKKIESNY